MSERRLSFCVSELHDRALHPPHVINGIDVIEWDRLVRQRAHRRWNRWTRSVCDIEDLYQQGWIGLLIAAQRFDHTRDIKFITYAFHWIDGLLRTYTRDQQFVRRGQARRELKRGVAVADLPTMQTATDICADEREQAALLDSRTAPRADWRTQLREAYADMMKPLSGRDRLIAAERAINGVSLEELGRRFGVTRERMRQIEERAYGRVRAAQVRYAKHRPVDDERSWTPAPAAPGALPAELEHVA